MKFIKKIFNENLIQYSGTSVVEDNSFQNYVGQLKQYCSGRLGQPFRLCSVCSHSCAFLFYGLDSWIRTLNICSITEAFFFYLDFLAELWIVRLESCSIEVSLYMFLGTSGGVMVSKVDKQTYTSEFDSHWVPNSCGLVLHLSKKA